MEHRSKLSQTTEEPSSSKTTFRSWVHAPLSPNLKSRDLPFSSTSSPRRSLPQVFDFVGER
jgi:hypothetical protein